MPDATPRDDAALVKGLASGKVVPGPGLMVLIKCRRHPNYRAKREPRADCGACRALWKQVNPDVR